MAFNITSDPLSAGVSALASVGNMLYGSHQSSLDYSRNRRMQERQYEMQKEMWNMTNEYNSPSNEVSRLRAAGINPNSALGNVIQPAQPLNGAAGQSPSQSSTVNPFSAMLDSMLTAEQIKGQSIENKYRPEQIDAAIKEAVASSRLSNQKASEIQFEMDKWTDILKGKTEAEIKTLIAQADNLAEQASLARKQGKHYDLDNGILAVKEGLAQRGILVDSAGVGSLVAALMNDQIAPILRDAISNLIGGIVEGSVDGVKQMISRAFSFGRKHKKP